MKSGTKKSNAGPRSSAVNPVLYSGGEQETSPGPPGTSLTRLHLRASPNPYDFCFPRYDIPDGYIIRR